MLLKHGIETFIIIIILLSRYRSHIDKLEKVKKGRYIFPTHAPVRYEEVPEDYHSFCVSQQQQGTKKK